MIFLRNFPKQPIWDIEILDKLEIYKFSHDKFTDEEMKKCFIIFCSTAFTYTPCAANIKENQFYKQGFEKETCKIMSDFLISSKISNQFQANIESYINRVENDIKNEEELNRIVSELTSGSSKSIVSLNDVDKVMSYIARKNIAPQGDKVQKYYVIDKYMPILKKCMEKQLEIQHNEEKGR